MSDATPNTGTPKDGKATEGKAKRGRPKKAKEVSCLAAWLKSPNRKTVDALAWVPGEGTFCLVPEGFEGHKTAFNTWRGLEPLPFPDDWKEQAKAFVDHVAYLVPIESERKRFMMWLAHIIQKPEVLPHTCYLMVTPTTGIGRNWLASILVRTLRGHVAVGVSLPEILDGSYNGRLSRKLLVIVDEAREGPSYNRHQRENRLRSLITEENRLINPKYGLQSIEKNCARWLMFSNYLDALPFNNQDRRVVVIDNPTVRKEDAYYEKLYGMVNDWAFIGSVRHYLETLDIRDFKPGEHAPLNQAKEQALAVMKSEAENAVDDFRAGCFREKDGKEECLKPLVFRTDINDAVRDAGEDKASANHITHAIASAGMISTGKRIKDRHGKLNAVVIVDTVEWTVAKVRDAKGEALLEIIRPEKPRGSN